MKLEPVDGDEPGLFVEGDGTSIHRSDHHVGGVTAPVPELVEVGGHQGPTEAPTLAGGVDRHGQDLGAMANALPVRGAVTEGLEHPPPSGDQGTRRLEAGRNAVTQEKAS